MADMTSSCWVESTEGTGEMVKVRRGNTAEDCTATAAVAVVVLLRRLSDLNPYQQQFVTLSPGVSKCP